ncbi:YidH family protein [Dyadobacter psychrotolerans]|uniref:YidH family protein n=1 Tax=Dyadobacter psychrotolerans TaxID=2541721 RepID=UPI001E49181B|nr:DUF202 domain-containing protein [Dyadobacter psychrotolerans]
MELNNNGSSTYKPNEHLANERTYLAWVRTGIGIMAFGFVVVNFSLFVKQIGLAFGTNIKTPSHGYSAIIGILLVAFGVLAIMLSYWQYRKTEEQLKNNTYRPSTVLTSI